MPNYYEYLQVEPLASDQEIQAALNQKYEQCKRLSTHDDPTVAQQANVALQSLEKIRDVLLIPDRRAVYDETLGLQPTMTGSLVTSEPPPTIEAQASPSMMEDSQTTAQASPAIEVTERLRCGNCNGLNPVGTRFCLDCGNEICSPCPKCGTLYEKSKEYCPACGVNRQQYVEEQEKVRLEATERQKQEVQQSLSDAETHLATGMYGLAKDALDGFEGLGNPIPKKTIICSKSESEWMQAEILNQKANTQRNALVKQNVLKITIAYAAIGVFLGLMSGWVALSEYMVRIVRSQLSVFSLTRYVSSFDWSYVYGIVLSMLIFGLCGALAGAVGSTIYFYQWGGRRPLREDLVFGAVAPILLLVALALNPVCFGLAIIMVAVWFVMITLGLINKLPI
jgi:hypothetical protein